ncbi:deoxynucleoside triphosphate triphosphohydrolase SAMHD1 homolog [Lucilia cuprina]|uniref:deoxynucleoside triphosphate triphosphohydrolase SAMHD1 homolog n=1 Tax=Lucilia cuprina TaxID=7375 RepID=UPI001F060124|nr:deoxynucleoside triphosphate triphosphohydrolase SAMHD1 homolog [Lucilia cuprina]
MVISFNSTYHVASRMLDALEENTQWLKGNNNEIPLVYRKAVQIAALLHDIAHGPFSHAWEHVVEDYVHETEAFPCIDHIFQQINQDLFPELRSNNNFGIELIKALIDGRIDNFKFKDQLPQQFRFIFEIVSNKRSKLDVDKWDYLKRDSYYLKHLSQPNMDFDDVFLKARVSDCGTQIEYRYEDYDKIFNLFAARYDFHVNCYSLPEYILCDHLLSMAVQEVKPKINNKLVTKLGASDMLEFLELTDENILQLVKTSNLSKFLKYETKFEQVNKIPKKTVSAYAEIASLQMYMPRGERISFYGDIRNKPLVDDQTRFIRKTYTGYCDHRTQTVYYTVEYE